MTSFSIIIPSFNQDKYIRETLENVALLKKQAAQRGIMVQLILVDNCSNKETSNVIDDFKEDIDNLFVEKDNGQYDAINKGLKHVVGDYWTWLNTDDLLDIDGFFKIADVLNTNANIDYIYGNVGYIDAHSKFYKSYTSGNLSLEKLTQKDASISQPGSFFKTSFTTKIGNLAEYRFAFDYEYILRLFKHNAKIHKVEDNVAYFRYYDASKSGSKNFRFLEEQYSISKLYGRKSFSTLTFMLIIRIIKRRLFN
ncbi:MAG: glycosyltransferase [Sphingobacteriaceae bacterium]|nr:glycosyltransferase [Sphingobacteriaceae bacterium]